jgi:ADP-ribose pyrophosphatase
MPPDRLPVEPPPPPEPSAAPDSVEEVFRGHLISVEVQEWPSAGRREVVHHPGACAVVALTPAGDVLLVRQFRESIRSWSLEIPAGILDQPGESPAECAARELVEETGHRAVSVKPLAVIHTSPGFSDERIHLFTAETGDEQVQPPSERGVEALRVPLNEAIGRIERGEITDAKSVAALLLAVMLIEPGRRERSDR